MAHVRKAEVGQLHQTLGERVKTLRLSQGLTQENLAGPGLPVQVIALIEANQCDPPQEWLRHFAQVLGVDMGWLTGAHEADLKRAAWSLAKAGMDAMEAGQVENAVHILRQASDFARDYGWRDVEAEVGLCLSRSLQMSGQVSQAVDYSFRSLLALPAETDHAVRLKMLILTGNALFAANNFSAASLLYDRARHEAPEDLVVAVKMLLNAAVCQLNLGEFEAARQTLLQAREVAETLQEPRWLAWVFIDLAVCDLGRHKSLPRVQDYLDMARQFALDGDDSAAYTAAIHNQGEYYLYGGRWAEAERCMADALSYLTDDNFVYAIILDDLAELYIHRRFWRKAQQVIEKMFHAARKIENRRIDGLAFRRRMQWHLARNQPDEAHGNFLRALRVFNEIGHGFLVRQTLDMWESHHSLSSPQDQ